MGKKFTQSKVLFTGLIAAAIVVIGSSSINSPEKVSYANGSSVSSYTSCSNCHSGSKAAGVAAKGSVTITGIPVNSVTGVAYPVSIIIKDPVAKCYGFNVIAPSGTFTTTNAGTGLTGAKTIHHGSTPIIGTPNAADSNFTITGITWTAPTTVGAAKFTLAANAANNNGSTSGDHTYTGTFTTTVAAPTPVTLSSFSATIAANKVNIAWVSTNELNLSYYGVERSADGKNFTTLNKVVAVGSATSSHSYTYVDDASKLSGTVYYRLNSIDKDGKSSYSSIKEVDAKISKNQLVSMYPNPLRAGQDLKLSYTSLKSGTATIQLTNALGKRVVSTIVSVNEGSNALSVSMGHLTPGVYYLTLVSENVPVQRQPLIVE